MPGYKLLLSTALMAGATASATVNIPPDYTPPKQLSVTEQKQAASEYSTESNSIAIVIVFAETHLSARDKALKSVATQLDNLGTQGKVDTDCDRLVLPISHCNNMHVNRNLLVSVKPLIGFHFEKNWGTFWGTSIFKSE